MIEASDDVKRLKASLKWALEYIGDGQLCDEAPSHRCGYELYPDQGTCDFCEGYWEARDALSPGIPPQPNPAAAYRSKCAEVEELRKALEYVEPWISGFICQCDDDVGKVCDRCTLASVINGALEGKE